MILRGPCWRVLLVVVAFDLADAATIDWEARSEVYFSSQARTDQIIAAIRGSTCEDAVFTVAIRSGSKNVFNRSIPLRDIVHCEERGGEEFRQSSISIVNSAIAPVSASDRSCGPPPGCWEAPTFKEMQRANVPLVCFPTGPENSVCVAFVPEGQRVVEVWRYDE
jgi:hypothetical protein